MPEAAAVSAGALARDPLGTLGRLREHGGARCLALGRQRVVLVSEEHMLGQMLVDGHRILTKVNALTGQQLAAPSPAACGPLLASDDATRHVQGRRLIQPAFAAGELPAYARTMRRLTTAWLDGLVPGRPFEPARSLHGLGCQVALETVFGGAFTARDGK